jgi:hypothetical protein
MDRRTLQRHLAEARVRAALGKEHLQRQRQVVADLEAAGLDTVAAREQLKIFQQSLAMHEQEVKRLTAELGRL